MACAARGEGRACCCSGRRRSRSPVAPLLMVLLCLWLLSGRASGPPAAPLSELRLLDDFRRQLQHDRPRDDLELELLAGASGPRQSCPGSRNGDGYHAVPDAIIRTKDSIAAGASFLRAPAAVRDWRQCVAVCCSEPRCSLAVVEQLPPRKPAAAALGCYLFNCTARGRSVCKFAPHRGYSTYVLSRAPGAGDPLVPDEPPRSKAGKDVVLRLPVDQVILDGRESTDDHAIVQYEWTLLQGDPSVDMKVPQPGALKLSHLQEGTYTLQLTVTDTGGQRSSDNVSVTVHPRTPSTGGCSNVCSRYHFFCDNGCCIDITLACDGVRQCPDGSDEDFCQHLGLDRKMVIHKEASSAQPGTTGLSEDAGGPWLEKPQRATAPSHPASLARPEKRNHSTQGVAEPQRIPIIPVGSSSGKKRKEKTFIFESQSDPGRREHPAPEAGAVLPLALGSAITALLLFLVACRLRMVKQKLRKARPMTSEESDYLINGMYL
uniref:Low-density lipoprotein receptor-related protein 11 n=1 Tax=Jaculus jaculus TaxID=51337 RepID=A0A8C5LJR1_JACJA